MFAQWCKNMNWCYEILLSGLVSKNSDKCVCFDPYCAQSAVLCAPDLLNINPGSLLAVFIPSKMDFHIASSIQFITPMLHFRFLFDA